MAGRRRGAQGPAAPAGAEAVARVHVRHERVAAIARFAPSRRSLVVGVVIVAVALGAYFVARTSSAFAIAHVEVTGGTPSVRHQVSHAAAPLVGTSLLSLDGPALARRLEALPTVVSVSYDRAFPHTLRIRVVPERPVAVVRRGAETWLVSARARVIRRLPTGARPNLARIWLKREAPVAAGGLLEPASGGVTTRALALASNFPAHIETASLVHDTLDFRLRSGLDLRLGAPTDVRLKLAIARRALHALPSGATYVDVSVPGRPVAGTETNSQLSG